MTKLTELIKCNVDIITRDEFDNNVLKCSAENKVIHELMDDKFGIHESRIDGIESHLLRFFQEVKRLECLIRNQNSGENHG